MKSLPLLLSVLTVPGAADSQDPPRKYQVVSPKDDGIIATGINAAGDVVGFEWVDDPKYPGVVKQEPFFAVGKQITFLPLLKGYTATFPAAVGDAGLVVGRVSKPAPPEVRVHMRNQAFVWDKQKGIRGLGALEGDTASFACGVSRDGSRISGFSVGPNRARACVWDKDGDGWKGTALPQTDRLGSQIVSISGDGEHVASVDGAIPCLWTRSSKGEWTREALGGPGSLAPRAVNNSGMVVGLRSDGNGLTHAVIWTRAGGLKQLEKPPGYARSEAQAVNNDGVVVGFIDGSHGSEVGPCAFAYEKGVLRLMGEGGPNFVGASAINDRGQVAGTFEKPETKEAEPAKPDAPKK